jgi:opacity protein-like surface antigen
MKKTIVILVITSFGMLFQVHAQSKFSLNAHFSPNYCNAFYKANNDEGEMMINFNDSTLKAGFGFHTGISFHYALSEKLSIGLGVDYVKYNQNGKWIDLGNSFDPYFPSKTKTDIHYQYVHLPLSVKYSFSDNALKFYALLGLSYQYTLALNQVVSLEYGNGNIETNETDILEILDEDDKLLPHNFGLRIGFGLSYNISENIAVFTEPLFHYSVLSEFRQKDIERDFETNLYSIGLQTGIAWHF